MSTFNDVEEPSEPKHRLELTGSIQDIVELTPMLMWGLLEESGRIHGLISSGQVDPISFPRRVEPFTDTCGSSIGRR